MVVAGGDGTIARADDALGLAAGGAVGTVDVDYVNGRLFLNTSSVGAYVRYVRARERTEPVLGYWLGSLVAGVRVLLTPRPMTVLLAADGATEVRTASLVFVGVGERRLGVPGLGQPAPDGRRGLHLVLPRGRRQARRFARAYARTDRGLPTGSRAPGLDAALVERFRLTLGGGSARVAVDGEITRVPTPLDYRFAPQALKVVLAEAPE